MFLIIEDHKDSIESIERDGQIIKLVGNGILKSPGHPAGNQSNERQIPLFKAGKFLIYNRTLEKQVEFLGIYSILDYKIKRSFEGFRYYEFTMVRVIRSMPGVEPAFPPE
jgi:hypothetical protein